MSSITKKVIKTSLLLALLSILIGKYDLIMRVLGDLIFLIISDNIVSGLLSLALFAFVIPIAVFVIVIVLLILIWRSKL